MMKQPKTLVIILSETRASELTFEGFKENVLNRLNADLCVCIGVKPDYDYNNPFYQSAKHRFLYNEPEDFGDAFDYAYDIISQNKPEYECVTDANGHVTHKTPLHWREFLKVKDQFLGGIKDPHNQHPGSAGILIFFRWFLLKNLIENNLINQYERFVITRSDFIYQLPHPKVECMNENCIWIPDGEHYGGYTDRHVVLSKNNIEQYLNILNNFVLRSNEYFRKMMPYSSEIRHKGMNLEKLIKFHLEQNNVLHLVKEFPYIMYSVRNTGGPTRWSGGTFSNNLGFYIKYKTEYGESDHWRRVLQGSGSSIDSFYEKHIEIRNHYDYKTPIPLNEIDINIQTKFTQDMPFVGIGRFINGVNSNSYNQIPDICKKYMKYNNKNWEITWSNSMIDDMLDFCDKLEYEKLSPNDYPKSSLQFVEVFNKFVNVTGKKCLVLGSISPWIECLLLHFNAESVTTLDYIAPKCNYKINTLSVDNYIKETKYDVIVSYSSLEHDGLGRYGDPLNPDGDIDACIEAYSMLNSGGYFICGIPIGDGCIEGNFHRIYNQTRIDKLFSLFEKRITSVNYQTLDSTLDFSGSNWQNQPVFVYIK